MVLHCSVLTVSVDVTLLCCIHTIVCAQGLHIQNTALVVVQLVLLLLMKLLHLEQNKQQCQRSTGVLVLLLKYQR
jgi:hypothetical protein